MITLFNTDTNEKTKLFHVKNFTRKGKKIVYLSFCPSVVEIPLEDLPNFIKELENAAKS
jgi:hypothetical protein